MQQILTAIDGKIPALEHVSLEQMMADPPRVSFEFFPPKTEGADLRLWETIAQLAPLNPSFVSVTYGAGGTTRERTHTLVKRLRQETDLEPAAHLTCVGASRDEIREIAQSYLDAGIRHIVALRGDAPSGETSYTPHPEGYAYADDLVRGLKDVGDFEISVAAYPEIHPEALSPQADMEHLKRKMDAGATRAITQYCFDSTHFFAFMEQLDKAQINVDLVPGILPIGNYKQMVKFSAMCGASVPQWVHQLFDGVEDDQQAAQLAIAVAAEQCKQLYAAGVRQFHFYTLNRADLVIPICRLLGIGYR